MPRALNLLRTALHYRREVFNRGLQAAGFQLVDTLRDPRPGDVLLLWNRYLEDADEFERRGATVLVAENCPLGNDFRGGSLSLARRQVALTGGEIALGGPERWDSWGVDLRPWRERGGETVILAQRGIGHRSARSPNGWAEQVRARIGGRIRAHPGTSATALPLVSDLKRASAVITWSSAAAVQALMLGVPVWHEHPAFVGAPASRPLSEWPCPPRCDDEARLAVLRRLAWGIWTFDEIASGEPIRRLTDGGISP